MNKTVASVIDDINEWENPRGGYVYYITAMFTDESVGSVGKKTKADAELVQRQLRDAIGEPLEFTLEDGGISGSGRQKWKIRDFGPPGIQGDGAGQTSPRRANSSRSPEHNDDIARAVALKAAVQLAWVDGVDGVLKAADQFHAWLTSEPALSAYPGSGTVTPGVEPAGAGSEEPPQETRPLPADSGVEGDVTGEGEAPSGDPSTPHIHDYQLRQGVRGFLVCECGKTIKKAGVQ